MSCLDSVGLIARLPVILLVASPILPILSLFGPRDYYANLWGRYRAIARFWIEHA